MERADCEAQVAEAYETAVAECDAQKADLVTREACDAEVAEAVTLDACLALSDVVDDCKAKVTEASETAVADCDAQMADLVTREACDAEVAEAVTLDACLALSDVVDDCKAKVEDAVTLDACLEVEGVVSSSACDSQKEGIQGQLDAKTQEAETCAADLAACNSTPAPRRRMRRAA